MIPRRAERRALVAFPSDVAILQTAQCTIAMTNGTTRHVCVRATLQTKGAPPWQRHMPLRLGSWRAHGRGGTYKHVQEGEQNEHEAY